MLVHAERCDNCFPLMWFSVAKVAGVWRQTHSLRGEGVEECRGVEWGKGREGSRGRGEGLLNGGEGVSNLGQQGAVSERKSIYSVGCCQWQQISQTHTP